MKLSQSIIFPPPFDLPSSDTPTYLSRPEYLVVQVVSWPFLEEGAARERGLGGSALCRRRQLSFWLRPPPAALLRGASWVPWAPLAGPSSPPPPGQWERGRGAVRGPWIASGQVQSVWGTAKWCIWSMSQRRKYSPRKFPSSLLLQDAEE